MDEQRKWLLEMESTAGEEAIKMTTRVLEYPVNLVDKEPAGFERSDSSFERSLMQVKFYQTATCPTEK